MRPPQDHEQGVGQPDQLLEVGRDQQHGQARGSGLAQVVPDRRPGRRRRCRGSGARRSAPSGPAVISRPTISFCWLPPDSASAATSGPGRADVELVDDLLGPAHGARRGRSRARGRTAAGSGGRASTFSHSGAVSTRPSLLAILRDVADPALPALPRADARDVACPPSSTVPRVERLDADDRLEQLGLAVALDAGDAEDLAPVDGERDVVEQHPAALARHGEAVDRAARPGRSPSTPGCPGLGSSLPTISSARSRAVTSPTAAPRPRCARPG